MLRFLKFRNKYNDKVQLIKSIDGINFYTIKGDILEDAYMKRYARYLRLIRAADKFKIDDIKIDKIFADMEESLNAGNMARVMQLMVFLKSLHEQTAVNEQMFEVANCFLMLENEPPHEFNMEFVDKKRRLFETNPDIQDFFLSFAHEYIKHLIDTTKTMNYKDYMNERNQKYLKNLSLVLGYPLL